ncbi:MAG: TIGR00730 family Rossman fold protein [Spongiibacteraceae bacterium]|jgi:uncharacterized protein (TIGR00730 family)|nr:TIGR00730 family Rossman fold protein [Spongiibacteraceae bacterium]
MPSRLSGSSFYHAREEVKANPESLYEGSSSYAISFTDQAFLLRPELRPVRLQLELLKAELIQQELGIESTLVVYGSARALPGEQAERNLEEALRLREQNPDDPAVERAVRRAQRQHELSRYYEDCRRFGQCVTDHNLAHPDRAMTIVTGGGPGLMEAANRGAAERGGRSIGMNITLPMEQQPNPYITPELCFQFHYFAIRKMHLLMRARAMVVFPGGFGTLDELFEALTLVQTGKAKRIPILLYGSEYWKRLVDWEYLVDMGVISEEDLDLMDFVDCPEMAWERICAFYRLPKGKKPAPGANVV